MLQYPMQKTKNQRPPEDIEAILRNRMEEILALIEAMAAQEPDCDIKLAALLENESEEVRVAIVKKLRELIRARAAEKETELNQYVEASKRQVIEQQRNVFMQWLSWIMSEETLKKIRLMFSLQPGIEKSVKSIGQQLFERGVLTPLQPTADKRELGELSNNAPSLQQGQGKGTDKGRE